MLLHILVVDDEAPMRDSMRKHFSRFGHRVLEAEDGFEGLKLFKENRKSVDLVITDIMMPKLNGVELIKMIRTLDPIVPILGITAHGDFKDQLSILGSGAYFYLAKPLPRWEVVDKLIENATQHFRNERSTREGTRLVRGYIRTHSESSLGATPVELTIEQIDTPHPSGDFAEAIPIADGTVLFYLADVSGHHELTPCLTACLLSIILHRSQHEKSGLDLAALTLVIDQVLTQLLAEVGLEKLFLTLFLGCLDVRQRKLTYLNAAHPAPTLYRSGAMGPGELLEATGRPVGMQGIEVVLPGQSLLSTIDFGEGDTLFLYSDGASELLGDGGGNEGTAILNDLAGQLLPCTPRALVEGIREHLFKKANGIDGFKDDTTLMAIRLKAH
jgi:phosphoserine phosphatase RsbU/P